MAAAGPAADAGSAALGGSAEAAGNALGEAIDCVANGDGCAAWGSDAAADVGTGWNAAAAAAAGSAGGASPAEEGCVAPPKRLPDAPP